jgi:predicted nucleic acid-binding protein
VAGRPLLLYLDQNYLSGIVKRKPAFRELEPALRAAVARGAVAVPESEAHRLESAARPDLPLLELLRELSGGLTLPVERDAVVRECELRLARVLERDFPERPARASDRVDLRALSTALPYCRLITCDAFMADVVRRTRLDLRFRSEVFTGRRPDVERLLERLESLE